MRLNSRRTFIAVCDCRYVAYVMCVRLRPSCETCPRCITRKENNNEEQPLIIILNYFNFAFNHFTNLFNFCAIKLLIFTVIWPCGFLFDAAIISFVILRLEFLFCFLLVFFFLNNNSGIAIYGVIVSNNGCLHHYIVINEWVKYLRPFYYRIKS